MIKKKFFLISCLFLFTAITCDNEPYEGDIIDAIDGCAYASEISSQALIDFNEATDDDFNLLCETYKDALQDQILICGDEDGALQALIDDLGNCISISGPTLCDLAIEATATAFEEFNDAITSEYEATCIIYRETLLNQIVICGDDGTLLALVEELGDCQPEAFNLVGDWRLIGWQSDIPRDINNDGVQTNDYLTEIDCFENETASFNADGTGTLYYRQTMEVEVSSPTNDPSNLEYLVQCFEDVRNFDFTWTQEGDAITVTLDSDGTVLDFFRNGDIIFIAMRDFFVATSTSPNVEDILQDIIWGYIQF